MRVVSQYFPFAFMNPLKIILFLFSIIAGCNHLGFIENSAPAPNIDVERSYFPNGNLEYEAEFVNGKLDGSSRVWLDDGTLLSVSEYNNDRPHGMWKRYYPNGNVMYEVQYVYGKKHGDEKWFYENKQIKSKQIFNNGELESEIMRWQSDGTLVY